MNQTIDFRPTAAPELTVLASDRLSIHVSRVGGGRVGKRYAGAWDAAVVFDGRTVYEDRIDFPFPVSHVDVADGICQYMILSGKEGAEALLAV